MSLLLGGVFGLLIWRGLAWWLSGRYSCPGGDFIYPCGSGKEDHSDHEFGPQCGLDDRSYTRAGDGLMRCTPEDHGC